MWWRKERNVKTLHKTKRKLNSHVCLCAHSMISSLCRSHSLQLTMPLHAHRSSFIVFRVPFSIVVFVRYRFMWSIESYKISHWRTQRWWFWNVAVGIASRTNFPKKYFNYVGHNSIFSIASGLTHSSRVTTVGSHRQVSTIAFDTHSRIHGCMHAIRIRCTWCLANGAKCEMCNVRWRTSNGEEIFENKPNKTGRYKRRINNRKTTHINGQTNGRLIIGFFFLLFFRLCIYRSFLLLSRLSSYVHILIQKR